MESIYQTNEPTGLEVVSRRFQTQPEWRQLWVGSWRRAITASSHPAVNANIIMLQLLEMQKKYEEISRQANDQCCWAWFRYLKVWQVTSFKMNVGSSVSENSTFSRVFTVFCANSGFLSLLCFVELFIKLRFGVGLCPLWHHKGHSTYTSYCYKYIINVTSEQYGTYDD